MHEKRVLKVAYICSILGITILFYLSQTTEFEERTINEITDEDFGKIYKMNGKVTKVTEKNNLIAVTITQEVRTTVFFDPDETIPKEGDYIQFKGKVNEYKDRIFVEGKDIIIKD